MVIANISNFVKRFRFTRPVVVGLFLLGLLLVLPAFSLPASAACDMNNMSVLSGAECAKGNGQPTQLIGDGGVFNRITSILLFVVGAVAVIMLIFGGIRYVVSGGDQAAVTAAKNTILYAIIGVVVAMLAYAAISFVTSAITKGLN